MILEYSYWWFKSVIPADVCNQIIEMGLNKMLEQKEKFGEDSVNASVGGWVQKKPGLEIPVADNTIESLQQEGKDLSKTYVRDSNVVFLNDSKLYELLWPYVRGANKQANWNFDWDYTEDLQFTKYGPGQFYGWHADANAYPYEEFDPNIHELQKDENGNPVKDFLGNVLPADMRYTSIKDRIGKIRKLSVTVSLNDPSEYDGGNLKFDLGPHREDRYHTCEEIRPQGSVIVFPSHIQHQVTPVTRGTRYSLVAWNIGTPWK